MSLSPRLDRTEKNYLINGQYDFWQRGTSFSITTNAGQRYLADRWHGFIGLTGLNTTYSRQTGVAAPFCMRMQRDSGVSTTGSSILSQTVEINFGRELAGKTITLQFRARAGTNYSPTSSILISTISYGTGASDANVVTTGFTGQVNSNQNNTLTTTFQSFTHTITLPSNATQIGLQFLSSWTGTAGANDYVELEQVMLSVANNKLSAKDFSRAGRTYQEELILCQRYYEKSYDLNTAPGTASLTDGIEAYGVDGASRVIDKSTFAASKRTTPTMLTYSPTTGSSGVVRNQTTSADLGVAGVIGNQRGIYLLNTNGATAPFIVRYHWTADAEI